MKKETYYILVDNKTLTIHNVDFPDELNDKDYNTIENIISNLEIILGYYA